MRKVFLLLIATVLASLAYPQKRVSCSWFAKKLNDKVPVTYEIQVIASIEPGWQILSTQQSSRSYVRPSEITISGPSLHVAGVPRESGKKVRRKAGGIPADAYCNEYSYKQLITIKNSGRALVEGNFTFRVCNGLECLPETNKYTMLLQ